MAPSSTSTAFAVTTIAGSGAAASVDGTGTAAMFSSPIGIAYSASAQGAPELFVSDFGTGYVRGILLSSGAVTTYDSKSFTLGSIYGMAVEDTGAVPALFVAAGAGVYQIPLPTTPNPTATPGEIGKALGSPATVALDTTFNIYTTGATDGNFYEIVNTQALYVRNSLATNFPMGGNFGLAVTGTPVTAYYTDQTANTLSSATTTPMMAASTVLATGGALNMPAGMTLLGGNLYIANCGGNDILKATTAGVVAVVAGNGTAGVVNGDNTSAEFNCPFGIANDGTNLYVTDFNGNTIREITNVQ